MNPLSAAFAFFLKPFIHRLDRPAMAKLSGHIALAGLRRPVKVIWQSYGVPHVFAEDESDLFFVQGYLHAQERLWQMESMRLFLSGRIAEVFGEYALPGELGGLWRNRNAVDFDHYMRLIGVRQSATVSESVIDQREAEHLQAYAQGVNRYIEERGKKLPWEFRLLRHTPEPWRPLDSITVAKGLALMLSISLYTRLNMIAVAKTLSGQPEKLRALWPGCPDGSGTIANAIWNSTRELWHFTNGSWRASDWHAAGQGSNSWAIAGERSTSGSAILCNDPHLRFALPAFFYLMHLRAEASSDQSANYEVWGASIPGLPYIQLGHNRRIAWGITAALCDDAELYREKIHRLDRNLYLAGEGWIPMAQREDTISVRAKRPSNVLIRSTRHGPVISDFASRESATEVLALRWTAHEPSNEFRSSYGINRAQNWEQFLAALAHHIAPTINYTYADCENNIGYALAGRIPLRGSGHSLLPLDGWNSANDWQGFIPFESLPRLYNPPEGVCATANNRIVTSNYPLAQLHEPAHRIRRIAELLNADERLSLSDMAAIQTDVVSLHARELVQLLAADLLQVGKIHSELAPSIERLVAWDGECRETTVEAALFHVFHQRLLANLLTPTLGEETFRAYIEVLNQCIEPTDKIFANSASVWFGERSREEVVAASLKEAVQDLRARSRGSIEHCAWGRIHRLTINHPFGRKTLLQRVVNIGPLPGYGDGMTVNAGFYRHSDPYDQVIGPSMRMVIDTGNFARSGFILPGGQSGHPGSPHYADQMDKWRTGKLLRFIIEKDPHPERCLIISPC